MEPNYFRGRSEEHAGTPPLDTSRVEGGDSEHSIFTHGEHSIFTHGEHSTVTLGDDGNPNRSTLPGHEEHAVRPPLDISRIEDDDSEHSTVTLGDDGNPNRSTLPGHEEHAVTPLLARCIEGGDSEHSTVTHGEDGNPDRSTLPGHEEYAVRPPLDISRFEDDSEHSTVTLGDDGNPNRSTLPGHEEHAVTPLLARCIQGGDSEHSTVTHGEDGNPDRSTLSGHEEHAVTPPLARCIEGGDSEHSTVTHVEDGNPDRSTLSGQLEYMSISKNDEGKSASDWDSLHPEIDALILALLEFYDLFRARLVCRSFRDVVKRKTFQQARGSRHPIECSLSPLVFYVKDGNWHILGYEFKEQIWRKLPSLDSRPIDKKPVDNDIVPIPIPDMDLFKDFLVSGHGGLFCVNVGKPTEPEKILVFNPLNAMTVQIPPLQYPRHPVVLHVHATLAKNVDMISSRYWILAVGSSATGTESLSRKTEVYDSVKGKWEAAGDVPGTDFSINEHQSGVYCESENAVLVTGFMVSGNKGVLVFDMETRTWREDWLCPYLQHPVEETGLPVHFAIAQLVDCNGVIYLFSEQESGTNVTHCIDALDMISGGGFTWTRKVTRQRQGYRALLVYPEYTCVPVRENKLCIFNTIERTGVIYNMLDDPINPDGFASVPVTPPLDDGIVFHSLNPVGYAYEPSFGAWAK